MAEMNDALLKNALRLASSDTGTVANIVQGAQYGFGNHLPNIDACTPQVFRPIVPIITSVPRMFQYLKNFPEVLKALVERHTREITGIDFNYSIEEATVNAGADSQMLAVPKNARRSSVNPTMNMPEITGNLVWNFFRTWQRMMIDPDTQSSSLAGVVPEGTTLDPHVMSMFSMDMLFIQYDLTLRPDNIIDAYFITGMWPNEIGQANFQKSVTESVQPQREITFKGVVQHNRNTRAIGVAVAQVLGLHKYNYDFATPIANEIDSALQDEGISGEIQNITSTFTPLGGNSAQV